MVVDERAVGVALGAGDARGGRRRLGHHVVLLEAGGGAVEWHPAEDARAAHQRREGHVELVREVGSVGDARGEHLVRAVVGARSK